MNNTCFASFDKKFNNKRNNFYEGYFVLNNITYDFDVCTVLIVYRKKLF